MSNGTGENLGEIRERAAAWHPSDNGGIAAGDRRTLLALVDGLQALCRTQDSAIRVGIEQRERAERERDSLRSQLQAVEGDARRYRWLRDSPTVYVMLRQLHACRDVSKSVDECLDSAIASTEGKP